MRRFLAAASALCIPIPALSAQAVPRFTPLESGACHSCVITVQQLATVGHADDADLIEDYDGLHSTPRGGYVVSSIMGKHAILHYDSAGRCLGKLGKLGDGPGEYPGYIQSIADGPGDSITIVSPGRIVTLSTTTGAGRSARSPTEVGGFQTVVLPDHALFINVETVNQPAFAVLQANGTLRGKFGPHQPPLVLTRQNGRTIPDEYATMDVMARSPSRGVWVASRYYTHHVQHLAADGSTIVDITRRPAWYQPYVFDDIDERLDRLGPARTAVPALTIGLGVDRAGHVLVLSRVADAHWKPDPNAPPPPKPGVEVPVDNRIPTGGMDRYVDGILEVYDDATGKFLGSWRSDITPSGLLPNGLIYIRDQDADGIISFRVYRVMVKGR